MMSRSLWVYDKVSQLQRHGEDRLPHYFRVSSATKSIRSPNLKSRQIRCSSLTFTCRILPPMW